MIAIEQVSIEPIINLLQQVAPGKLHDLDELIKELNPRLKLDFVTERILFQADSSCNTITVGVKCTCRLQAHAYAYAIILSAFGTQNYCNLTPDERKRLFAPADPLLNWAVGSDLQQWAAGIDDVLQYIFGKIGSAPGKNLLANLTDKQRILGEGYFRYALAFIFLHELAHLKYGHIKCGGDISIQQEKEADLFAAEWLIDSLQNKLSKRMASLYGIAIALLWLTVRDIFLGPQQSSNHPPGYDRLFQVLNQVVDNNTDEEELVFHFLKYILFCHIDSTGIEVDGAQLQGSQKEQVNYLINLISKEKPW